MTEPLLSSPECGSWLEEISISIYKKSYQMGALSKKCPIFAPGNMLYRSYKMKVYEKEIVYPGNDRCLL
jgi:hypothetical protein